jgi:amino acid adenylation domain-containing protein
MLTLPAQAMAKEMPPDSIKDKPARSRNSCIHELFEEQVERTPDAIAVVFENHELTYGELNARANQLGHYLQARGVGPEVLVGICVERSLEMIVGLLGILKAGGAYLPLDPSYPRERLSFMLEDGGVKVLLTQEHLRKKLSSLFLEPIVLNSGWETIALESSENLATNCSAANLAYVMYTSGSTGKPKGVSVIHRGVVRLVIDTNYTSFGANEVFLQAAPFSFDASTFEIWGSLLNGARLVLMKPGLATLSELGEAIKLNGVTTLWLTAGLFHQMVETQFESLRGIRQLLAGGDVLSVSHVQKVARELDRCQLINGYGPTENTTFTCCYQVNSDTPLTGSVPIGLPIAHTDVYILDGDLKPVGVGMPGELFIGGDGLARGYLNDGALTAVKFVPNPLSKIPGTRLYRTGDIVRLLAEGSIEFLGRIDQQVKIRGHRVELGEIEAALARHPAIAECAVVVREDEPADKQLVGYIVQDHKYQPDVPAQTLTSRTAGQQVAQWRELYDQLYSRGQSESDPTFNTVGWNSSYTGEPISEAEMREWREQTVKRIFSLQPQRVWEIGCGSGLLLFEVAPGCNEYWGTDFSAEAISRLKKQLAESCPLPNVRLSQRAADDFSGVQQGTFDTVIINSVVQYFPNAEYLLRVLEGAIASVKPGGHIFIGDIRNLTLIGALHFSIQLQNAPPSFPVAALRERVRQKVIEETELLVAPDFFSALTKYFPRLSHVELAPKRGKHLNELTRFRYDVTLHIEAAPVGEGSVPCLSWQDDEMTLTKLVQLLNRESPGQLCITSIPNARVSRELHGIKSIERDDENQTVAELRDALQAMEISAPDPEEFWELSNHLPYSVQVTLAPAVGDGSYDVVLTRDGQDTGRFSKPSRRLRDGNNDERSFPHSYTNQPLAKELFRLMLPDVRRYLRKTLPDYMVPSEIVLLDVLPLTPNGKVDRKALPPPGRTRPDLRQEFVAPRTPLEDVLAGIWEEVLRLHPIGIHDNFFELGGHSLKATQLISRVREAFRLDLPVSHMFESPTVAGLATQIDSLSSLGNDSHFPELLPESRDAEQPLSFAQQRLWFINQLDPGTAAYNIPLAMRLRGELNAGALERSLREIVRRHESLRTMFVAGGGKPAQVIANTVALELPVIDLSHLSGVRQQDQIDLLSTKEARTPFNLREAPLLRASLLRLSDEDHVLLLNMHHIVSDGWSMGVLFWEMTQLYSDFASGEPSSLPPLRIQYTDYALWQRRWLQGGTLEKQLSYWRARLKGAPAALELPTDHPRNAGLSFSGARQFFEISRSLSDKLRRLSLNQGATLYMILLAVFQVLLSRYTGQDDIVVGTPIANRSQPDIEGLIGFFVNTLVMRTDLSDDPTFIDLLQRVREVALGAYAHQDLPFEKLVEELQPDRTLGRNPIFQVMFVLQNAPARSLDLQGLSLQSRDIDTGATKFDLTLSIVDKLENLAGHMEYNTDLYDGPTITRMLGHFQNLLEGILADPEQRISDLPLLGREEAECLFVDWNNTEPEFPTEGTIVDLFEVQVKRSPTASAVVFEDRRLTYAELNTRANQLAHLLRRRGVGLDTRVGLCFERSAEMLIGLLGILKAGGAYVPLNPDHPKARLLLQLKESECRIVVTQEKLATQFESFDGEILNLDQSDVFRKEWEGNLEQIATPESLVYVIYTSGSTGVPKAVAVTHRNLVNYTEFIRQKLRLDETSADRQLHFATVSTISADLGNTCIFPSLVSGGCLHILSYEASTDSRVFANYVARQPIDVLKIVPSHLNSLLASNDRKSILPRKYLILGGESLSWNLVQRVRELSSVCEIINHYGPTETTVGSLTLSVDSALHLQSSSSTVPIGRPVLNTKLLILDRNLKPVPIGVPGELYIGGAGLTRGYLNNPEETQRRFIANPFSDDAGERLYKTGDRVRYLPDGNVEFLGRVDDQVKIRGYRIEPAEIEIALLDNPEVKQAVVIAREDRPGDKVLVAYVVSMTEAPATDGLRTFLSGRLPDYMLPAAFVFLDELPLTANGKLDGKALPAPSQERDSRNEVTEPRTPDEAAVASIWADVLNLDLVDVHDNFFLLGGHSLLITQVISRVREILAVELPVRSMFESPTVATFCEAIARARSVSPGLVEPRIGRLSRDAYRANNSTNEPIGFEP